MFILLWLEILAESSTQFIPEEISSLLSYTFLLLESVTRLDDLLDFGQLFKAFATINLPKSHTFLGNFYKGVKIYHFWQIL